MELWIIMESWNHRSMGDEFGSSDELLKLLKAVADLNQDLNTAVEEGDASRSE